MINVYFLYANRVQFWNGVSSSGALNSPNIILDGGLNLTLFLREVWGTYPRQDPQECFFSHWIEKNNLIDLEPLKLTQTW
jgi:hypothetical protein